MHEWYAAPMEGLTGWRSSPAPFFFPVTVPEGQPRFRSTCSQPRLRHSLAAQTKYSARLVRICGTTGIPRFRSGSSSSSSLR